MVERFGPDQREKEKRLRTAECKWCGHEFSRMVLTQQQMRTCSPECKRALMLKVLVCKIHVPICTWCGSPFSTRRAGVIKYCSSQCRAKGGYVASRDVQLAIKRERYVLKPPHIIICIDCGETSSVKGSVKRCPSCRVINARAAKRDYEKRRDARKRGVNGVKTECIKVAYIYDRDAWRCGVCGKRVDKALAYPHLMSASLDHIVPLVHGGTHTKANVQLAHFICNSIKSDSLDDVRPLLFG